MAKQISPEELEKKEQKAKDVMSDLFVEFMGSLKEIQKTEMNALARSEAELNFARVRQVEAQTREIELHSQCLKEEHLQKIRHNEERHRRDMGDYKLKQ